MPPNKLIKKMIKGRDRDLSALRRITSKIGKQRDFLNEQLPHDIPEPNYDELSQNELKQLSEDQLKRIADFSTEVNDLVKENQIVNKLISK